jgi:hypothetical protein
MSCERVHVVGARGTIPRAHTVTRLREHAARYDDACCWYTRSGRHLHSER